MIEDRATKKGKHRRERARAIRLYYALASWREGDEENRERRERKGGKEVVSIEARSGLMNKASSWYNGACLIFSPISAT